MRWILARRFSLLDLVFIGIIADFFGKGLYVEMVLAAMLGSICALWGEIWINEHDS